MNIFGRIKRFFIRNLSVTDEKAWNTSLWNLAGTQSVSGETVTEETALTYSAVWCAVSLIAGTISTLPLNLMQRKNDQNRLAEDRKLFTVMHSVSNPRMTAKSVRECMMLHVLTWGNSYSEIVRNGMGEIIELWPITPNRVKIEMREGDIVYRITMIGEQDIILPRERVLHIPGLGFDGFQGYSPIAMARKSLGLGMAMETFGSRYFGQGTHPGIVVSHPSKLGPDAHKNLRESLLTTYSGLGQAHRLMLLEDGMKLEKLGIPPNDSQFLESRQHQVTDVARWYNLPPHKLKDLTKSSFNNIESEQTSFVQDCIRPWLVTLEQNYDLQLLTASDRDQSGRGRYYFKHIAEGLLRGDTKSRAEFYSTMLDKGVFSINEVRELEDRDPVEGGDIHLVPLNMTTLENAGKQPEPEPQAEPEPAEPTTPPQPKRQGGPAR